MKEIGMMYEGCLHGHLRKRGAYEDLNVMGIMKDEFTQRRWQ